MRAKGWLLLLLACHAAARDPFAPSEQSTCQAADPQAFSWYLQGVIGRAEVYDAWLVTPSGQQQRLHLEQQLPGTPWRIERIDMHGLSLVNEQSCQLPLRLVLKGGKNVTDNLSVTGTD